MFSFFQKKIFLADHLKDFVDIHSHVLPGLDDGAENIEASMQLLTEFEKLGIIDLITTPHVMNDFYPNTPLKIGSTLKNLELELEAKQMKVKIRAAAEYMLDQAFLEIMEKEELLCLIDNLILVELSYFQPPINLKEILFKIKTSRYQPILAHPERYIYYHSKDLSELKELKDLGCQFQLNFLSLTGHYGKNIQQVGFQLLKNKLIDFVGSDVHQLRHLEKLEKTFFRKDQADLLLPIIERTRDKFHS